jgi:hypothetical protein
MAISSSIRVFAFSFPLLILLLLLSRCTDTKITAWHLFPSSTVAVLESTPLRELGKLPLLITDVDRFLPYDSLEASGTVAWLAIEKNRHEELLVLPESAGLVMRIMKKFGGASTKRNLNGYDFLELTAGERTVCVLSIADLVVISTRPLVIESVIRTVTQQQPVISLVQLKKLPNLKQDQGNLYINWSKIPMLWPLAAQSFLDVQHNDSTLVLDGFTLSDTAAFSWQLLKAMEQQSPMPLGLQDVVPQGAQTFLHLGMANPEAWHQTHLAQLQKHQKSIFDSLHNHLKKTGFLADRFFSGIEHELGFIATDRGQVIVAQLREITKVDRELKKLRLATTDEDQSNINFSEHGKLFHYLFWPFAPDFTEVHYAVEEDVLFLANAQPALQLALEKVALDQTWGKTLAWQKFHAAMLTEANVSFFFAQPVPERLTAALPAARLEAGYAQFSNVDQQFYTNVLLRFSPQREKAVAASPPASSQIVFNQNIQTPPFPVLNHTTKETEVILIDGSGQLTLIAQNRHLWTLPVGTPASGIFQVDYFKNRKLQYVLVAGQKLHLVDRLGRAVKGFPVALPEGEIRGLTVIDYDQSRNYRFLITYARGEVYLLDRSGKLLEGWNPKKFPEQIHDVRFQRMKGKDYFVALGRRTLFLANRRGEEIAGFPFASPEAVVPIVVADTQAGAFLILSQSGKLQWVDVNGRATREKLLQRHSVEARFYLMTDSDRFFVLRTDRGKIALLTPEGDQLYEVENPGSNRIRPRIAVVKQKPILLLYDEEQQLVHVISHDGRGLPGQPLEASAEPGFQVTNDRRLHVFTINGRQLATTTF